LLAVLVLFRNGDALQLKRKHFRVHPSAKQCTISSFRVEMSQENDVKSPETDCGASNRSTRARAAER
jgi:hypothetical protein